MEQYESELTRRYLLNSHSRGSLEEVVAEEDAIELHNVQNLELDSTETKAYMRKYYE